MNEKKITYYRKDYQQPTFWVKSVDLAFMIEPEHTIVKATINFSKNPNGISNRLRLNGVDLELLELKVDGKKLSHTDYELNREELILDDMPERFQLQSKVKIYPSTNTALEGLYQSGEFFLTQCEAQGFRKITFYPDRPDVLAPFTVTIIADRHRYPVLLSNGNHLMDGKLSSGRHYVKWQDPHPKPSYLFALVAGDLEYIEDHYRTQDGLDVQLRIYTESKNIDACGFAMKSLINAMQWDEERFDLAYDLEQFNIVVTDDFNMGAMENKGLNIFNSKCVLAKPETATDDDFIAIEAIIGHEYFHNWTGNRVTCKDWFQLSLKEGLTVFRDQEFTSDMQSPAVKRIEDVRHLRAAQFAEDAGPMSHSVRPDSYMEINNFYTLTVYEKGAQVVRMYHTLLGEKGFQKGIKLYFQRHDGEAVSCNDFRRAMADANGVDLTQFELWYAQNGTPEVTVETAYDSTLKQFKIRCQQQQPASYRQQTPWQAMHIPMRTALYDKNGKVLSLNEQQDQQLVLEITEMEQEFVFENIAQRPTASLFQDFSAPVTVKHQQSAETLAFLMRHDQDSFNRWDAAQKMQTAVILQKYQALQQDQDYRLPNHLKDAFRHVLIDSSSDPGLIAEAITLPTLKGMIVNLNEVEVQRLYQAKQWLVKQLVDQLHVELLSVYNQNYAHDAYQVTPEQVGKRRLKNRCLWYLMHRQQAEIHELCLQQYQQAGNYTDRITALTLLVHHQAENHQQLLDDYYQQWQDNPLMINRWLSIQATKPKDALKTVNQLLQHSGFSLKNPNAVRSLIGAFCAANLTQFHAADGSGYRFLADQVIELDTINPQIAARMVSLFNDYRQFNPKTQQQIQTELNRIHQLETLSPNVFEIVDKALSS